MTETVREVPLSLQVFHSHNEYKAHRRNRTEQIYLKDLSAGLGREEKLYVKEYAFQRSSFHRHYARRFSAPLLAAPSIAPSRAATAPTLETASTPGLKTSRQNSRSANSLGSTNKNGSGMRPVSQPSPRASVFSASASLRHVTPTTNSSSGATRLATKMLDGLKEVSVSTRFQRIQRKFSIASMTEHGCLTAEGNSLADDIQEARKRLFKRGGPGTRKPSNVRELLAKLDAENNKRNSICMVEEKEEGETEEKVDEIENVRTSNILNSDDRNQLSELRAGNGSEKIGNFEDENSKERAKEIEQNSPSKPNDMNEEENNNAKKFEIDPRMKMPFLKLRAGLNFSKQKTSKAQGHVTIAEPIPEDKTKSPDETAEEEPKHDEDLPQHPLLSQQTSSIFKRFLSNTPYTEPLQLKIKTFLKDQAQFNYKFPKGQENRFSQSERHKELLSGEKEKKEKLQKQQEKKKEIVFEVLTKLGITDEHIWFHYDQ